jgi:putative ABC transport system permease protein
MRRARDFAARLLDLLLVALARRLAALRSQRWRLRPAALDRRLAEELAHHRRLLEQRRRGHELGDAAAIRRQCRAAYRLAPSTPGEPHMSPSPQELLAILRGLRRSPLFTLSSVVVLTLGTAATITLFGVVYAVLIEPLPYPDADRLVRVWGVSGENRRANHNPLDLADYDAGAPGIEGIVALAGGSVTWQGAGGSQRLPETIASTGWLRVLGIDPVLGRDFAATESLPGQDSVALLGHAFWRNQLGADPEIVGRALTLDGLAHTIVGVLPPDFAHPLAWDPPAVVRPLTIDPANSRGGHYVQAIARLAEGSSIRLAEAEVQGVAEQLERQHPSTNRERSAYLVPLREGVVGDVRELLAILSAGVSVLLLITAANVGALFLTRTLDRTDEHALRTALGAGRARLLATLAFEGLVVALIGTAGGVGLAWVLRDVTATLGLSHLPWGQTFRIDGATIGFALALALFTATVLTLPALLRLARHEARARPTDHHRLGAGRPATITRRLLVTGQVALSVVLLVAAGLLTESLDRLLAVDAGFDRSIVATARISLPRDRYQPSQRLGYFESLRERMLGGQDRPTEDLEAFGLINSLPLSDSYSCDSFIAGGRPLPEPGQEDCAEDRVADWGYFDAMGIQLLEGRALTPEDREGRAPVVVVNRTLARRYWPGESAVGQRLRWGGPASDTPWQEIVGVIADVRHFGLDGEVRPEIYTSHRQYPASGSFWVTMRSDRPQAAIARLRAATAELDPTVPVFDVQTMEERVLGSVEPERLRSLLLRLFAGAAVILTAVGLWGLIAYATTQARRELGVRLALGADRARILGWVLREGLRPILIGAALGLIGAWAAGRLLAGELFHVPATHAPTLVGALLLLGAVGLAATLGPALRALRLDPMIALREE